MAYDNPGIKARLFGPWSYVTKLLTYLEPEIRKAAISAQRKVAESYVRKIKAHLRNQDIPGWTPLTPKYADWKMGKFGNEDLLMASTQYYESIEAWRSGGVYMAGVKKGQKYKYSRGKRKREVSEVAYIHEMWSMSGGNKPKRPLWGYTLNQDMGGKEGIRKLVNNIFRDKLRDKGYPVEDFL